MKLLPDTHLLLWAAYDAPRLPKAAFDLITDPDNEVLFSAATLWETSIKARLNKSAFQVDPRMFKRGLIDNGYVELPVTGDHGIFAGELPLHHKDPFDRLLIAQATVEGILLLTSDDLVARYPGPIRLV